MLPQTIQLYDKDKQNFIHYTLHPESPIPLFGANIIKKMQPYIGEANGFLRVIKTNMPKKTVILSKEKTKEHVYKNIHTCTLDGLHPKLKIVYSTEPLCYYGEPKLCLAHKMYGFPFLDVVGDYGISNRDNYVIIDKTIAELQQIASFLRTKTALYIFEAARYRMKYLEKYAFEFIPDITKLPEFPKVSTDESIAEYFGFDNTDREHIEKLHRKDYSFIYKTNYNV